MNIRTAFAIATALVGLWLAFSGAMGFLMSLVTFLTTTRNTFMDPGYWAASVPV